MKRPTTKIFHDTYHLKGKGNGQMDKIDTRNMIAAVKVRVTYDRKTLYYPTGIDLSVYEYNRLFASGDVRLSKDERNNQVKLIAFLNKANDIINSLPLFTFKLFEDRYLSDQVATDNLEDGFKAYISKLRKAGKEGTAVAYECALTSLQSFNAYLSKQSSRRQKTLKYIDITVDFLNEYQRWVTEVEKNSISTVGFHLRALRSILNKANVDRSIYPFGDPDKGLYQIPASENIKKSLNINEIKSIFNYKASEGSNTQMAKDYWFFSYICNGINIKDICFLKWSNVDLEGQTMQYIREKSKNTKKKQKPILISLKPQAIEVIRRWGIRSVDPNSYIFPHIKPDMTPQRQRAVYQQLTKLINTHMKRIARELKINKPVTTYYARHSFSTILMRSGVSTEYISQSLGHSDLKTTKNYLGLFEEDAIHKTTDVLLSFTSETA